MKSKHIQATHQAIIFAGASGAGKSTIIRHLLAHNEGLKFSVSACTRPKRLQEVHGQDYYFLSVAAFKQKIAEDAFLEWEEVYTGHYYGTLKTTLADIWTEGYTAIFDVDVQGALRLKDCLQEHALAVYVKAPSQAVLAARLRQRGTEDGAGLVRRLAKAVQEDALAPQFDAVLVNEDLPTTLHRAQEMLVQFLEKAAQREGLRKNSPSLSPKRC